MADITGLPAQFLTPEFLGSLQNTLQPSGVLGPLEAAFAELEKGAAAKTAAAAKEAAAANQSYTQAAAQPAPDVSPLGALLQQSLGNVASVIGQDKSYGERARTDIQNQRKTLMQARIDNLAALKLTYEKKASALEQAGHDEEALKTRLSLERINKQYDLLSKESDHAAARDLQKQKSADELKAIAARGQQERLTQKEKPATVSGGDLNIGDYVTPYKTRSGQTIPIVRIGDIAGTPTDKGRIERAARSAGLRVVGDKGTHSLDLIDAVRGTMDSIRSRILPLLPTEGGLSGMAQGAKNKALSTFQVGEAGPLLAGYPATRTAAIQTIQALASLGPGLRINQAEIKAAQEFDYPRITDTQQTATEKFGWLDTMMDHIERAALGNPPTQAEVAALLKRARDIKAGIVSSEPDTTGAPPDQYRKPR